MSVAFNPVVSFKSDTNLIADAAKKMQQSQEKPIIANMDSFNENLKSRKWEKEYLPESDIIVIKRKKVKDGLEYMLKNDGTVLETGNGKKATVIAEPGIESAKQFGKLKQKYDPNAPKKTITSRLKNFTAKVWKFFSVAGTMTVATAKGIFFGALTGATLLTGAMVLRAPSLLKEGVKLSEILKHPLKSAGKKGKLISAIIAASVLATHIILGKLNANQNTAVIDHKLKVGHRDA